MSLPTNIQKAIWESNLKSELKCAGYDKIHRIANTLQGSIYKAIQVATNQEVVIKVTDKHLHRNSISTLDPHCDNTHHAVQENIISEGNILKKLTYNNTAPKSIVKFVDLLECDYNYYLIQEFGGG
eukprot:706596_1